MKRSILFISLCVLGAAAAAQSSVNISGGLKVAVAHSNDGTTPVDEGYGKGWSVIDLSSYLTFSGKEDLGGGMYAGFDLSTFVKPDVGQARDSFWARRSVVKLGGSFGEVYAGRSLTPQELMALLADPWYWDGSSADLGWVVQQANYRSTSFIRTNNTVGYVSPKVGGFTLSLAASAGEGTYSKDLGGSLTYENGPLWVGVALDQSHGIFNNPTQDHVATIVGAYDFGVVRPRVSFTSSKVNGVSYKSYGLAATAPVGASGLVMAQYSHLDDFDTTTTVKEGLSRFGVGYQHSLSKRTNLFANVSHAKAETRTAKNMTEFGIEHSF